MVEKLIKVPKNPVLTQYLIPFYKERFVTSHQITKWFRLYNYHQSVVKQRKKFENYVLASHSPDTNASGVTFIGSGYISAYIKYIRWLTVKHRLIVELGRSTKDGWHFSELCNEMSYENVSEEQIRSACESLREIKIEFYDVSLYFLNTKEIPRESYINSVQLIDFKPPYLSLDLKCQAGLQIVNFVHKLSELVNCPMTLIDASRYELEGFTREHCLTQTDIYTPYMLEKREKYHTIIHGILKQHLPKEELFLPTHSRYKLYV